MNWKFILIIDRYETEGLKFFASKPEYRTGPNNIVDLWKDFTIRESLSSETVFLTLLCLLEAAEDVDDQEELTLDDDQYPQLPDTISDLSLHRRKAILRQFVAKARRMYYLIYIHEFKI